MFRSLVGLSLSLSLGVAKEAPPAPKAPPTAEVSLIQEVGEAYGRASSVQMRVEKRVKSFFSSRENRSEGTLLLKKGNLRLELKGDENSLVVIHRGRVKVFTFPPKESGLKVSVVETTFKKNGPGEVQEIFASLLTGRNAKIS